ncbi:MAG: hypothetical protein IPJ13_01980 [Saprospiraceae bacterium]|nr:hypothetical protein [Saprospiraceae bacterium]
MPFPYVAPEGRFNEIYYWDSYFTMLGLRVDGKTDLIESMIDNFAWLIGEIGFIPNGNRTYFLSRSQPPFFSMMVTLLAQIGDHILLKYMHSLEKNTISGWTVIGNRNEGKQACGTIGRWSGFEPILG